jgi:hypothetical protein
LLQCNVSIAQMTAIQYYYVRMTYDAADDIDGRKNEAGL